MEEKIRNIQLVVTDVDGTLTDGGMYITEKGDHFKRFHTRDGMAAKLLKQAGKKVGIMSHSVVTSMVEERARMLDIPYCFAGKGDKLEVLDQWREELGLEWKQVAYIGDDINDLSVLKKVGFSACPADAVHAVKQTVDVVLSRKGGEACFREWVDEWLLSTQR